MNTVGDPDLVPQVQGRRGVTTLHPQPSEGSRWGFLLPPPMWDPGSQCPPASLVPSVTVGSIGSTVTPPSVAAQGPQRGVTFGIKETSDLKGADGEWGSSPSLCSEAHSLRLTMEACKLEVGSPLC